MRASSTGYDAFPDDRHCNYATRVPYRDPVFAILFVAQLAGVIALAVVFAPHADRGADGHGKPSQADGESQAMLYRILASLAVGVVASLLFGFIWLRIMQTYASKIIRLSIQANIALQTAIGLGALLAGLPMMSLIMFISAGVLALWYFLVRKRTFFSVGRTAIVSGDSSNH